MKAHELSSLYSEEKAKLMRQVTGQVDEKNSQLNHFMSALQIDKLHLDNFDYLKLPKELLECCASLSVRPGLLREDIPKAMKSIVNVSVQTKEILSEIEETIEAEEKEHRKQGGQNADESLSSSSDEEGEHKSATNKFTSSRKTKLKEICKRYDLLSTKYADANSSNAALHEAFNSIMKSLQVLSLPLAEITDTLPKIEAINDEESKTIKEKLVALIDKVDEMKAQRQELFKRLQQAIHQDDLTKTIAAHQNEITTSHDEFFSEQLKKHEQLVTYLTQNLNAQDNILRALADANAQFTVDRKKILEATQQRNASIDNLVFSYQSVGELIEKANKGVVFFETLNTPMRQLLKDVKEFCAKSETEREATRNMMARFSNPNVPVSSKPFGQVSGFIPGSDSSQQMTHGLNTNDRPKLKDFLPQMKPQSWGSQKPKNDQNNVRPKNIGPPVIDRTSFLPAEYTQMNQNQINPVIPPSLVSGINQNIPPRTGQNMSPSQNFPRPEPVAPPNVPPQYQIQMPLPAYSGQPVNHYQQQVVDPRQNLFDKALHEQQMREQELLTKKRELEEKEQQLRLQQQQFMLQQQQQQFILQQQQQIAAKQIYQTNQLPQQNVSTNSQYQSVDKQLYNPNPNTYGFNQFPSQYLNTEC